MSPSQGAALLGLGLGVLAAVVSLSGWFSEGLASLLAHLAWGLPGLVVAPFLPRDALRPRLREIPAWLGVAGLPMALVVAAVAVHCALGQAQWDPGGAGLVASWGQDAEGRMALDVSAPHTLALLQACMVAFAPLWGLPMGIGLAAWARALPTSLGAVGVGLLVGTWTAVWVDGAMSLSAGALAALVVGLKTPSIWPAGLGLGGLLGLSALGPLLATGDVGLQSPLVWIGAGLVYAAVRLIGPIERARRLRGSSDRAC